MGVQNRFGFRNTLDASHTIILAPVCGRCSSGEGQPIFSNGRVECCDLLNNVERVVVPAVATDASSPKKYVVRVMAFKLIDSEHQVGTAE